jgi:TatD DNase family protein
MEAKTVFLIDTHTHTYLEDYFEKKENLDIVQRAKDNGIYAAFLPNIDSASVPKLLALYKEFPDFYYPMMGLHPTSVTEKWEEDLQQIREEFEQSAVRFYAIGETGIDLYWDKTFKKEQIQAFKKQIDWSFEMNLPLSIHARNSMEEIIDVLQDYDFSEKKSPGIFHCFSGNSAQAKLLTEKGFALGIGGVLTFKNAELANIIKEIDVNNLVMETDSPFLAPVPYRGKRNEVAYTRIIAEKLAEIKKISLEELANITSQNAKTIFGI